MLQQTDRVARNTFAEPQKAIVTRDGIGSAILVEQTVTTCCQRLNATDPTLALVKRGRKIIRTDGQTLVAEEGTVVVFPAGFEADITNEVDRFGKYRALLISFSPETISHPAETDHAPLNEITSFVDDGLHIAAAMEAALDAIRDQSLPEPVVKHRVSELLLWLKRQGIFLAAPPASDFLGELKRLIGGAPATNWQAPQIAATLGMSEATLRRRLAKQKQSVSKLILETRMLTALTLLQAGDQPIVQVSYAVGYDSPSRFALRFKQRFGFPPSELRKRSA